MPNNSHPFDIVKNRFLRILLFTLGCLSLILGLLGVFLPLLPTTPFLILTAWCFFRSSPRAHDWMREHPYIGKTLSDWEERGAISSSAKVMAISLVVISLTMIWLKSNFLWLKIGLSALLFLVSTFILTRPSR